MNQPTLQDIAVQKSLNLSERDARKVLIFMSGLEAGVKSHSPQKRVGIARSAKYKEVGCLPRDGNT